MPEQKIFEDANSEDMRAIVNSLLGVLGVSHATCPATSDTKHMLWHATEAALRKERLLREIKQLLKGADYG